MCAWSRVDTVIPKIKVKVEDVLRFFEGPRFTVLYFAPCKALRVQCWPPVVMMP